MGTPDLNQISAYHYELPPALIAQQPINPRDHSRLLVCRRESTAVEHFHFYDLPLFLRPGDCLVLNQTKVIPARLYGFRTDTNGQWEGLFLQVLPNQNWQIIGQTRGKLQAGETLTIPHQTGGDDLVLKLIVKDAQGRWEATPTIAADVPVNPWEILEQFGTVPLPPYIQDGKAKPNDKERYQTVYAATPGAVAAPTAGLHFTPELMKRCEDLAVEIAKVTLHVGLGTFRPVSSSQLDQHEMHAEWCELTSETAQQLQQIRQQGGRVIAVGTTSVRTLETAAQTGEIQPWQGESELFIRPGHTFHAVDGLITNFHLPQSTLLVLLAAFMGYEPMLAAYRQAVAERYRFYSYGDAMLIL